jgi:hypothetical protein
MKLLIFLTVFSISFVTAQNIDSTAVSKITDTIPTVQNMDSLQVLKSINRTKIEIIGDTTKISQVLDSSQIENLVRIRKSLLDSLLSPYYKITYDTVAKDTLYMKRYRMVVNEYTNDTSYIAMPKKKKHVRARRRLVFDTLRIDTQVTQIKIDSIKMADAPVWWHNENSIGLAISESAFLNWNAGGNNSVAGLFKVNIVKKYQKLYTLWNNELFIRYGLNQQEEKGLRKTEDKIQLNSTFGYRKDTISNWYYSVKFNFNTQFTNGYSYPDTDTPISRFFAPAYLFFGTGTEYNLKDEKFSIYLSPLTLKSTFVFDERLSNDGAFGVEKGRNSRHEFGFLMESSWITEIFKNVEMSNRLGLYTDYINNFGNIDVDWQLDFKLNVNKHIKANIGGQLIYDDDIKYKEDTNGDGTLETLGPRVQLRQALNIGVLVNF